MILILFEEHLNFPIGCSINISVITLSSLVISGQSACAGGAKVKCPMSPLFQAALTGEVAAHSVERTGARRARAGRDDSQSAGAEAAGRGRHVPQGRAHVVRRGVKGRPEKAIPLTYQRYKQHLVRKKPKQLLVRIQPTARQ